MTAMTRSSVIGSAVLGQAGGATVFSGRLSGHLRRPRPQRPRLLLPTPGRPRPLRGGRQGRKGRPRCPRRATAMVPAAGRASCRRRQPVFRRLVGGRGRQHRTHRRGRARG